jgi:hypothetical protein
MVNVELTSLAAGTDDASPLRPLGDVGAVELLADGLFLVLKHDLEPAATGLGNAFPWHWDQIVSSTDLMRRRRDHRKTGLCPSRRMIRFADRHS